MTDHAVLILDAPLFAGIEAEGPFKGEPTLFVADPTLVLSNIAPYLARVAAVYLGSARLQPINFDLARDLLGKGVRLCFEIGNDVDASAAIEVVAGSSSEHHLVFTEVMLKPDGTVVVQWPRAKHFYQLAFTMGLTCSLKQDDGQTVCLLHRGRGYINAIDAAYAADVRLDPVL